jgi:hypothetical protein
MIGAYMLCRYTLCLRPYQGRDQARPAHMCLEVNGETDLNCWAIYHALPLSTESDESR